MLKRFHRHRDIYLRSPDCLPKNNDRVLGFSVRVYVYVIWVWRVLRGVADTTGHVEIFSEACPAYPDEPGKTSSTAVARLAEGGQRNKAYFLCLNGLTGAHTISESL